MGDKMTLYRLNEVLDPDGQLADLLEELVDNGALTILEPTEIRWCQTHDHKATSEDYCWLVAHALPKPKHRCHIVTALHLEPPTQ